MGAIDKLSALDAFAAGDLLAVYDSSNGDNRKAALSLLVTYLNANLTFSSGGFSITQYTAPATGATVNIDDTGNNAGQNINLFIVPASPIAILTVTLPVSSSLVNMQEILVNTAEEITTLTLEGGGATIETNGSPSAATLSAGGFFRLRYYSALTTWYRVG